MKSYQDHDHLHGNGKASPKPKSPNFMRMISRFFKISINPNTIHAYKAPETRAQKCAQRKLWKKQQRVLKHAISLN